MRARTARFTIIQGNLYKRGFSVPLMRYVAGAEVDYILKEIHEGMCGNHIGVKSLASKTLRQGYFWPTLAKDAKVIVKKCQVCQIHRNLPHCPPELLTLVVSPWTFQQWGLDIVGPLPVKLG